MFYSQLIINAKKLNIQWTGIAPFSLLLIVSLSDSLSGSKNFFLFLSCKFMP